MPHYDQATANNGAWRGYGGGEKLGDGAGYCTAAWRFHRGGPAPARFYAQRPGCAAERPRATPLSWHASAPDRSAPRRGRSRGSAPARRQRRDLPTGPATHVARCTFYATLPAY